MSRDYTQPAMETTIKNTAKSLRQNGFTVEIVDSLADAKQMALALIPKGSRVFNATSETSNVAGITKAINESGDYVSVRNESNELYGIEERELERRALQSTPEYVIGSVSAVTEKGELVATSATGSQLPSYAFGANHVVLVVGAQKIVSNVSEAIDRIESYIFPLEDARARATYGVPSAIRKVLIYREEKPGRVTVILVRQPAGY